MDRELLQRFFFKAMCYTCSPHAAKIISSVGSHPQIVFQDDFFRFEERYGVSGDGTLRLAGNRKIFFLGEFEPAWSMEYHGYWKGEDLPFLSRALLQEYQGEHFTGGRGPNRYTEKEFTYENRTFPSSIDRSCGHEKIYKKEGELFQILGHYIYFAGTSKDFQMERVVA
jgi:hypothetical protein